MTAHIAIPVTNLERSLRFYSKLGFVVGESWERPDWEMSGTLMEHASGSSVELIQHPDNGKIQYPPIPEVLHVGVPVKDVEQLLKELVSLGGSILRPVMEGIKVKKLAFLKDPDGLAIEVFEPRDSESLSPQAKGLS